MKDRKFFKQKKLISSRLNKSRVIEKISVNELVDRVKRERGLSKREKFAKVIDIAYKRLYNVKKESWECGVKKINLLVYTGKKESHRVEELGNREIINDLKSVISHRQ